MSSEHFYKAVEHISQTSLEIDPEERASYIDEACQGDEELKSAVQSRLDQYRRARHYFAGLAERLGIEGLRDPRLQIMEGQEFGNYNIEHELGQGGMGIVFKALDRVENRPVALKFLLPRYADDEKARLRFAREAAIMESMQHENLPVVYEVLEYNGLAVIAMEYIEGLTLKEILKGGALQTDVLCDYAIQIAKGLGEIHQTGIMHRDLKPANIMITSEGVVKILDFGLAKVHEASSLTRTGATLGTVAYMSPEQARGGEVDYRTDIWALGVILFEMMSGQLPFKGGNDQAVIYSILNHSPDFSAAAVQETPGYVCRIIQLALSKDVDQRFQRAQDVADALLHPQKMLLLPLQKDVSLKRVAHVVPIIVLAILAFIWINRSRQEPYAPLVDSIAVLPFHSDDPDMVSVARGLSVVLTDQINVLDSLRVISPSSAMKFRNQSRPISDIHGTFGVSSYLDGELRVENDSVHLALDLVEAHTGDTLWRRSFSDLEENLYVVGVRAVDEIAEILGIRVPSSDNKTVLPSASYDAYLTYLEGRYYTALIDEGDNKSYTYFLKADSLLSSAVELDSTFADAVGNAALLRAMLSFYEGSLRPELLYYVEKSLSLDPENQYGLLASAWYVLFTEWDWLQAEEIALRLAARHPQSSQVYGFLGRLYQKSNRDSLSLIYATKAWDLNPISSQWTIFNLISLIINGRYSEAIDVGREMLIADTTDPDIYAYVGKAAYLNGQDSLAVAHFDRYREMVGEPGVLMSVNYLNMGYVEIFNDMFEKLIALQNPERLHYMYLALRDTSQTLNWLEKDLEEKPLHYLFLLDRNYDELLKDEPRFRAMLRKANMEPFVYKREGIAPFDL